MMQERESGNQRLAKPNVHINSNDYLIYKYLFPDLKDVIKAYANGAVLDVGCGNKPYYNFFQNISSYVGCDLVQSSMKVVDIICPATELMFQRDTFDTVFCTQVLEHVEDHRKAVKEAVRVLKPGGIYIFSVPFTWQLHEEPYDFFRFTKYGIEYMLKEYGLEKIELRSNGGKWATIGQMRINILWSLFRRKKRIGKACRLFIKYSGIKILMNIFYSWLDRIEYDDLITLNYVVVARKK